jgi:hypothetical protein
MQQFIASQQMHRMTRTFSRSQLRLLRRVCLVHQKPAWIELLDQSREELELQKEKDEYEVPPRSAFRDKKILRALNPQLDRNARLYRFAFRKRNRLI